MDVETIYCCEISDVSGDPEASIEYLSSFEMPFSTFTNADGGGIRHVFYLEDLCSSESISSILADIPDYWKSIGVRFDTINLTTIAGKDWAEAWKQHFPVQHVSEKLVVRPGWLEYTPRSDDEIVLRLDPGMSFGTGRHETTRFCLRMIESVPDKDTKNFLDIGCGSGILAIAALKMGFAAVSAFDNDPACVQCAVQNMRDNRIDPAELEVGLAELSGELPPPTFSGPFDVVAMNVLSSVVIKNIRTLMALLKPGGSAILAGILGNEFQALRSAME
ncbi:MAG: 50S ribosomal protein L11 methyltransferase, partial [Victivallales bacterium]|nr:50S ribosomal protein L11 methyltransferase [Victivallales bacterium]